MSKSRTEHASDLVENFITCVKHMLLTGDPKPVCVYCMGVVVGGGFDSREAMLAFAGSTWDAAVREGLLKDAPKVVN